MPQFLDKPYTPGQVEALIETLEVLRNTPPTRAELKDMLQPEGLTHRKGQSQSTDAIKAAEALRIVEEKEKNSY